MRQLTIMKTMTCKQLGGACDKEFHANTFDEMAEMSKTHGMEMFQKPFRHLLFATRQIDPPYCYRCPLNLTFPSCQMSCIDPLEQILRKEHHNIAAVVVEPLVQAVAGMIAGP